MKDESAGENKFFTLVNRCFVALPIVLHLAIVLPLAYLLNIWMDEASTLYTTRNGFFQTFSRVFADEKQAPLYFLILSLWRAFSDSIFFARIFSILCSALTIYFFYQLARKFLDETAAKFITFFFAINPYLIWASVEIRVYSAVILLSILLLKIFSEGFLSEENVLEKSENARRRAQIFYAVTAVAALYANYYLGFILVGNFAALLITKRWKRAKTYFALMLIVGALFAPLVWVVKQQYALNTGGFSAEKSIAEGLQILWHNSSNLIFPVDFASDGELSFVSILRIWFVRVSFAAIVFYLFKDKFRVINEKVLMAGANALIIASFLLFAYFTLGAEFVAFRHFAVFFAPLILFLGVLLTNVLPRNVLLVFAILLTLLFPYSKIYKQFPNLAKRGDWARVARFIEENEKPNQPIIVFQNYDALTLPFHYHGVNKILPDEKFFDWSPENSLTSENAFQNQIAFVVSEIPPDAQEIWLATEGICQDAKQFPACRPLEDFIEANYTVIETKDFYLERVRLLRKK